MKKEYLKRLLKTIVLAAVMTSVYLGIGSWIYFKGWLSERGAQISTSACYALICILSGWYLAEIKCVRRFILGATAGTVYYLLMGLVSYVSSGGRSFAINQYMFVGLLCIFSGMLGGMLHK